MEFRGGIIFAQFEIFDIDLDTRPIAVQTKLTIATPSSDQADQFNRRCSGQEMKQADFKSAYLRDRSSPRLLTCHKVQVSGLVATTSTTVTIAGVTV